MTLPLLDSLPGFHQAIAIARECGLDRETFKGKHNITEEEKLWIRVKQRVWLSLFVANTMWVHCSNPNTTEVSVKLTCFCIVA